MLARIVLAWFVFTPLAYVAVIVLHGGVVMLMVALIAYIESLRTPTPSAPASPAAARTQARGASTR